MDKVKVVLSDPQVLFREGIHFILSGEDDFEVIGETTNNEEAFSLIMGNPPHIAILSMRNGKFDGPVVTSRLKRSLPSVSIILTMDKNDEDEILAAMKSGTSACLTKDIHPEYLLDIIRVVAQGSQPIIESLLIPKLASKVLASFEELGDLNTQLEDLLATLTLKETEILNCIAAGNNIEQITEKVELNEEGVRRNLRMILNKLVANNQSQALIEATQRSLPSIMRGSGRGKGSADYVTREEFNEFKENLMERFKSFIGKMG